MNGFQVKQVNRCLKAPRLLSAEQNFIVDLAGEMVNDTNFEMSEAQESKLNQLDTVVAQGKRK